MGQWEKIRALFESRRFWVSVAGILVVISEQLGNPLGISDAQITELVILAAAWVVGDSVRKTL